MIDPVGRDTDILQARMQILAESFPTLCGLPGVRPWNPTQLFRERDNQLHGPGKRAAAAFLLFVWGGDAFDLRSAWGAWDDDHRNAWKAWARAPWWA